MQVDTSSVARKVGGAQAGRFGFVITYQVLADFDKGKPLASQRNQQLLHLVDRRQQAANKSAGFKRSTHLRDVIEWIRQVEEKSIAVCFVTALLKVA